jgi:glucose-6-phosphate isomerase
MERFVGDSFEGIAGQIMTLQVSTSGASSDAVASVIQELVRDKVASRIFARDETLWGVDAEAEASIRLGWVDAASESLEQIDDVMSLRRLHQSQGLTRIVLCGMGGSSLAPEVIAASAGVDLVVLDSTHPSQVRSAVSREIEQTVVVVSSKSGSTVETDSQKRIFEQAFEQSGIDKTSRIIVVTDPNSPMHKQAVLDGYRVFLANPNVGGRFSALTMFGVVPSVLAGADMMPILRDAISTADELSKDEATNPALVLGAAMARTKSSDGLKDKLGIVSMGTQVAGLAYWMEQLIAESTGKLGRGVLPVVLDSNSPELLSRIDDLVSIGISSDESRSDFDVNVSGDLGSHFLLWEVATAVAARLLKVNPFDQPDVESAKIASRKFLESKSPEAGSLFTNEGISVSMKNLGLSKDSTLRQAFEMLVAAVDSKGYIAIHSYLDRQRDGSFLKLRDLLAMASGRPTTFGWGPRFLHSTGQYHKGGPTQGVFLQLITEREVELMVPGRDFGFQELMNSQAAGDANVLAEHGRPVLTLRFRDQACALLLMSKILEGI